MMVCCSFLVSIVSVNIWIATILRTARPQRPIFSTFLGKAERAVFKVRRSAGFHERKVRFDDESGANLYCIIISRYNIG